MTMIRYTSAMLLATSLLSSAWALEQTPQKATPEDNIAVLMVGCQKPTGLPNDNPMILIREGLRDGHAGRPNAMPSCKAYTMGFNEGYMQFKIRGEDKPKLVRRKCPPKLMDNQKIVGISPNDAGGLRTGSFTAGPDMIMIGSDRRTTPRLPTPITQDIPCKERDRESPHDDHGAANPRDREVNEGNEGNNTGNTGNTGSDRGASSGRDYSAVDREASRSIGSDNAARGRSSSADQRTSEGSRGREEGWGDRAREDRSTGDSAADRAADREGSGGGNSSSSSGRSSNDGTSSSGGRSSGGRGSTNAGSDKGGESASNRSGGAW